MKWQEDTERKLKQKKEKVVTVLNYRWCILNKTPKIKNLLMKDSYGRRQGKEADKALCMSGRKQIFSLKSRWRLSPRGTLMILFHEPAHLKHISLKKWHHHFISHSRSLKRSKNKLEAGARKRKQKKQFWQQNDDIDRYITHWLKTLIVTDHLAPVDVSFVSLLMIQLIFSNCRFMGQKKT